MLNVLKKRKNLMVAVGALYIKFGCLLASYEAREREDNLKGNMGRWKELLNASTENCFSPAVFFPVRLP